VRCEPAEWTNTFRLLSTVKDDDELNTGEGSVVIVLQDNESEQLDTVDATPAAEYRRRRWREMPLHMRSSVDGSGQSSSVASVPCRGPRAPSRDIRPPSPSSPSERGGNVPSATATPDFWSDSSRTNTTPAGARTQTVAATVEPMYAQQTSGKRTLLSRHDATCFEEDVDDDDVMGGGRWKYFNRGNILFFFVETHF